MSNHAALIEKLAALAHSHWVGWMHQLFSSCHAADGHTDAYVIPGSVARALAKQMVAPYDGLSEPERDVNRAIAAQQVSLMALDDDSDRILTCAYCGQAYPPGTPASGVPALTAHIKTCAKHPMRELEEKIDELEHRLETEPVRGAEAEELRKGIEKLIEAPADCSVCDCAVDVHGHLAEQLQALLDRVDARDSLAHLEKIDELKKALQACVEALDGPGTPARCDTSRDPASRSYALELAAKVLS